MMLGLTSATMAIPVAAQAEPGIGAITGAGALSTARRTKGKPGAYRAAHASSQSIAWEAFVKRYIESTLAANPSAAVALGRHEYDGRITPVTAAALDAEVSRLQRAISQAQAFDPATLSVPQRRVRDYLIATARGELFWRNAARWPMRNPGWYQGVLDPSVYTDRTYAAPDIRLRAFIAYLRRVPQTLADIRVNLAGPMPPAWIDYGVKTYDGYASYFASDAKQPFASVRNPALQKDLSTALKAASEAMRGFAQWLKKQPQGDEASYALGPDLFSQMLRETELVDVPLATLQSVGTADLQRNQAALTAACAQYAPGASIEACVAKVAADKPKGGAVQGARDQLASLKAFVQAQNLVTIPSDQDAAVEEAPPYARQNFAYIQVPAPFERVTQATYYIAPPDPSWPEKVQADYVPGKADLLFTSVHEVWPGHYLQFLHSNRAPSQIGRIFVGYAFAEGWAHYTEEMMWQAGLNNGQPETHVGQILNALLRDCRYLSAIGLHTQGMTVDQSRAMFQTQCYQDEGNARQQAARGTYDPAYLSYTMGKLMIMQLREDWTRSRGGRSAWQPFHDQFLSYGGPPIPLIRSWMMNETTPKAVFPGMNAAN